jgi:hypothetical protein
MHHESALPSSKHKLKALALAHKIWRNTHFDRKNHIAVVSFMIETLGQNKASIQSKIRVWHMKG